MLLLSQGTLRLLGWVLLGMVSSIVFRNSPCHVSHGPSISSGSIWSQLMWSTRVQALWNSAYHYLQIVCDLTFHCLLETLHLSFTGMPKWSEFPKGGTVVQFKKLVRQRQKDQVNERTTMWPKMSQLGDNLSEQEWGDQWVKPGVLIMMRVTKNNIKSPSIQKFENKAGQGTVIQKIESQKQL